MKNAIIAVLVVAVISLTVIVLTSDGSNNPVQNSNTDNQSSTSARSQTLDLSNQGLNQISQDLLKNDKVVVFNVSNNNLTGALPAEIRFLTNLEQLIANDNNLTGIPAEIGQLSKLKFVDFSNNDISGLPLELGNLSNLETLDLRGNPNVSDYDLGLIQPNIPNAQILTD